MIQTTKLDAIPFDEVGEDQAIGESEGDKSLPYWREVHDRFFRGQAKERKKPLQSSYLCVNVFRVYV